MLKAIKSKKAYEETLNRVYELMQLDLKLNANEYNELEILSILIEDYENKNFPISLPDPIEAIKFRLEQLNLERSDLVSIIGSKSRTSEILNKKRKLSLSMIRALHKKLNIPSSSLISEY
ncbi:MAG: transcriptional regulator [Ignavibacteriae bacterium]|nr:transcriptional regulator [Ignavibacteriota bacterium]